MSLPYFIKVMKKAVYRALEKDLTRRPRMARLHLFPDDKVSSVVWFILKLGVCFNTISLDLSLIVQYRIKELRIN